MEKPFITHEDAKKFLDYNPETGKFFWKISIKGIYAGRPIGNTRGTVPNDYLIFFFRKKRYYLHRMAWFIVHGYLPNKWEMIDHINQDKTDNRIENLRIVNRKGNVGNYPIISTNTSGYRGVSWDKRASKWVAYIYRNTGKKHIGSFKTPELAAKAYDVYAKEYFGACYANLNFPEAINA